MHKKCHQKKSTRIPWLKTHNCLKTSYEKEYRWVYWTKVKPRLKQEADLSQFPENLHEINTLGTWYYTTTEKMQGISLSLEEEDAREERSGGGGGRDEKKSPRDQLQADRSVDTLREECKTKWLPETDTDDSFFFSLERRIKQCNNIWCRKRKEDVEEVVSGGRDKNNIQWRNSCLCRGWTHFLLPQYVFLLIPLWLQLSLYSVFCQQDKRTWKESIQLQMKNWSNSLRFMVIPFFFFFMFDVEKKKEEEGRAQSVAWRRRMMRKKEGREVFPFKEKELDCLWRLRWWYSSSSSSSSSSTLLKIIILFRWVRNEEPLLFLNRASNAVKGQDEEEE